MKKYIKLAAIALAAAATLLSCTEKFDDPAPYKPVTDADIIADGYELITIADLQQYFHNEFPNWDNGGDFAAANYVQILDRVAIKGKVISTDWYGNVYRSLFIQDHTGGMEIKVGLTGMFGTYPLGTWVYVKAYDLILGSYRYNLSLGVKSTNPKYNNNYIDLKNEVRSHILVGEYEGIADADILVLDPTNVNSALAATYPVVDWDGNPVKLRDANGTPTSADLPALSFDRRYLNSLVRFEGIESRQTAVSSGDNSDDVYTYGSEVFPTFLANLSSGDFADGGYVNFVFQDVIDAWIDYEDNGVPIPIVPTQGGDSSIAMPRPGTDGIQDPYKPFLRHTTWAFRNYGVSYYGSSLWRLGNRYFTVRTSGYSNFALEKLPETGDIVDMTGIITRYSSSSGRYKKYQIQLNTTKDVVTQ